MLGWMMAAVACLAGLACQLAEPVLRAPAHYQGGVVLAALLGLVWLWGGRHGEGPAQRGPRRRGAAKAGSPGRLQTWPAWRVAAGLLALASLAWGITGWRASSLMAQGLPPAWLGRNIPVEVQIEGLPRLVQGAVLVDARVLRWPGLDQVKAAGRRPCCLPAHISLRWALPPGQLPWSGERWHLHVRLHPPDGPSNPGGHDASLAYFERGVRAVGTVVERAGPAVLLRARPPRPWEGWIDRQRQRIRADIQARVADPRAAGVLAGLSVGDQSAIERDDWEIFRRTGVAHLVSISGAHIAMMGWLAAWFIRLAWARWPAGTHRWPAPDVARWAAVLASTLYAMLAGWGIPAQRTVWMMLVMLLLRQGGRRWPWPLVWLVSAVAVAALDPWALWQPSFWLSFVAVAVLMSSGMSMQDAMMGLDTGDQALARPGLGARASQVGLQAAHAAQDMWRTQWRITVALTPLAVVCFQQVSIVGLAANAVAIPVFTLLITPLALLGALWAPFWDLGAWLIQLTMALLADMSARTWAVVQAPAVPWFLAACMVLAGLAQAQPAHWAWRLAALPFFLPLLYLPQPWRLVPAPPPGQFQVLSVDVGQGTAVLVRTAHHSLLYDTGPRIGTQSDAGERTLLPLMRAMGVTALDALLISHEDTDHIGGAATVVAQWPVGQLIASLPEEHSLRQQPDWRGQPLPYVPCRAGQHWVWDGVHFAVLHPLGPATPQVERAAPNTHSCVLRVSRPGAPAASALLTGDIEAAQEEALVKQARTPASQGVAAHAAFDLRSSLLIAPHHGSSTSSTTAFLKAVAPQQVLIQVGRRNAYQHPADSVLTRYRHLGLPWLATPTCGAHIWQSNEAGLPVGLGPGEPVPTLGRCWRASHRRYWDAPAPWPARQMGTPQGMGSDGAA